VFTPVLAKHSKSFSLVDCIAGESISPQASQLLERTLYFSTEERGRYLFAPLTVSMAGHLRRVWRRLGWQQIRFGEVQLPL
jgi:hypothetical protein